MFVLYFLVFFKLLEIPVVIKILLSRTFNPFAFHRILSYFWIFSHQIALYIRKHCIKFHKGISIKFFKNVKIKILIFEHFQKNPSEMKSTHPFYPIYQTLQMWKKKYLLYRGPKWSQGVGQKISKKLIISTKNFRYGLLKDFFYKRKTIKIIFVLGVPKVLWEVNFGEKKS